MMPELPQVPEGSETDGVAVACSLDGTQYTDRAARWRQVLGDAPRERTAAGGVAVQLPSAQAAVLAELVVAEQECCPFFTFHLAFAGPTLRLTADAPVEARPLVDALFGLDEWPAGGSVAGQ